MDFTVTNLGTSSQAAVRFYNKRGTARGRDDVASFGALHARPRGETGPFRRRCKDRGPKPAETLAASGRPAYTGVGSGESKRKSRLNWVRTNLCTRDGCVFWMKLGGL